MISELIKKLKARFPEQSATIETCFRYHPEIYDGEIRVSYNIITEKFCKTSIPSFEQLKYEVEILINAPEETQDSVKVVEEILNKEELK